jgi:2'-5' RNA ligase
MNETVRAFIAIPLPKEVIERIRELGEQLKKDRLPIRWVKPENIHLTMKFLGDIPESSVLKILREMKKISNNFSSLNLFAKGIGVFPGVKRPRVLWVGVRGDLEKLAQILTDLEQNLEKIGFPRETRPFKSHLTIGRMKRRVDPVKLAETMKSGSDFSSPHFRVKEIVLFQSKLKPSGAQYTRLGSVTFGENDT